MMILSPSILAADFMELKREIQTVEENGAKYLHFDVMDGIFVPSLSFGMPVLEGVRKVTKLICDVHLMITEPIRYIEEFKKAGADYITFHYEACEDVDATIAKIKDVGCKVGISIRPDTPVSVLEKYVSQVDMVLIMCVYPGFGGQKFIPESLNRIRELKAMLDAKNLQVDIQVDGGIYISNVEEVVQAGANIIVSGTGIFRGDVAQNTRDMMKILEMYE